MQTLTQNIGTIAVLVVLGGLLFLAARSFAKNKNSCNKCEGCGCNNPQECKKDE
ncbi:hypothetical protein OFO01_05525 [Campylobacter sp. JMF_01 NE2]|uniref:FeoB-associated Cys-rich membrane protein n=1 Tax=unclassified Campylobacter TaxID=2593542 RepID=UPI001B54B047|nr:MULTISPECIES: FeoB-associated Cys-rich membrane protein [unclassified Campylobacter]MBP3225303.1 FeoB-associated Cys-rich membrane protein [Campylobacter sp.]MDA3047092.1 hypothetical protein [Campylobacter sp. VBCF_06 NA8]MDA3047773.1 hypothetical protein [Campylobacter sp. JMF_08 NE1]MDA3052913.1 hypothetical protein [Campylobacter sp. JMF_03 NE3]MDA3058289.1 hypothetical protein [Campylobacter sp. VBCF_04 NA7]